jgi:hypothetical protein
MGCIHRADAPREATNQVGFKVAVSLFLVGWLDGAMTYFWYNMVMPMIMISKHPGQF